MKKYLLILLLSLLAACDYESPLDKVINNAGEDLVRIGLIEACGKEDKACIKAVNMQFKSCQKKYRKEYRAYMNAGPFDDEDKLLKKYSEALYSCIIDANGKPYFVAKSK